jgi:hypothetical protein
MSVKRSFLSARCGKSFKIGSAAKSPREIIRIEEDNVNLSACRTVRLASPNSTKSAAQDAAGFDAVVAGCLDVLLNLPIFRII